MSARDPRPLAISGASTNPPTKQEYQRIQLAAYRRKLTLNQFIYRLLNKKFSPVELSQIARELGDDLLDRIFEVSQRKAYRDP